MKKIILGLSCLFLMGAFLSCGGGTKSGSATDDKTAADSTATESKGPAYEVLDNPQVDLSKLTKDKDDYYVIFDGKSLEGWRGYGRNDVPSQWSVDAGAIKFTGKGKGEAQDATTGGDLIFSHKFKNFILELEWKVAKGANSGIFYLAQEIKAKDPNTGEMRLEPIYISSPEYQVLDNVNHIDAQMGEDGNRQSGSLYDMIPAKPQNSKPFGQWNKAKIMVSKGTIVHGQNDKNVLEYHLWTPQWTDMLQKSKFSEEKWPLAFELLNNCGGENHEGYIGFQDHGDDVWFRNIRVKVLD